MSHAAAILAGPVYGGYQYAYPHKTAYRPLTRPVPLRECGRRSRRPDCSSTSTFRSARCAAASAICSP